VFFWQGVNVQDLEPLMTVEEREAVWNCFSCHLASFLKRAWLMPSSSGGKPQGRYVGLVPQAVRVESGDEKL